jgi:uncharacterized protein (UPF0335 family)
MSVGHREEDSGPGLKSPTSEQLAVMREKLKTTTERVDRLWEDVDEMSDSISDVKKVQIGQGAKLEAVIEFHAELKKYARWAITGVFGLIALQLIQLILKKGTP